MRKPDPEFKAKALAAAEVLREAGDVDGMAHYLIYLHERNKHLEDVFDSVKHYIHSGQAVHEHTMMKRAIDKADQAAHSHEDAPAIFGSDS